MRLDPRMFADVPHGIPIDLCGNIACSEKHRFTSVNRSYRKGAHPHPISYGLRCEAKDRCSCFERDENCAARLAQHEV